MLTLNHLSHKQLLSTVQELSKPIEALTPPANSVAKLIMPLDQGLHQNIIDGVCFGDSSIVLEEQSYIKEPIKRTAVLKQAYASDTRNNNTYLHEEVFKRNDMSYKVIF